MTGDQPPAAIWYAQEGRDALARRSLKPLPIPRIGGTVASLLKQESDLEVSCLQPGCRHRTTLSAAALAARYGEGRSLQAIINAMICTQCGAKGARPAYTPRQRGGHGWGGMWGGSPAGRDPG